MHGKIPGLNLSNKGQTLEKVNGVCSRPWILGSGRREPPQGGWPTPGWVSKFRFLSLFLEGEQSKEDNSVELSKLNSVIQEETSLLLFWQEHFRFSIGDWSHIPGTGERCVSKAPCSFNQSKIRDLDLSCIIGLKKNWAFFPPQNTMESR